MQIPEPYPRAMTIAGSDSGAGAGIQADLKTFSALGVYGTTVITALTAQNTLGVQAIFELPPEFIGTQIDSIMKDIGTHSAKTGMLASEPIIEIVAEKIRQWKIEKLVIDPVMVAKSGDQLLRDSAISTMLEKLFPLAFVVTPNIPEAERITGRKIKSLDDMKLAAEDLLKLGPKNVVIKGGHLDSSKEVIDILYDGHKLSTFKANRINSRYTHGTGCTFSAAIAAFLAKGNSVERAVQKAKEYITSAINSAFPVGKGCGPVHHFYNFW